MKFKRIINASLILLALNTTLPAIAQGASYDENKVEEGKNVSKESKVSIVKRNENNWTNLPLVEYYGTETLKQKDEANISFALGGLQQLTGDAHLLFSLNEYGSLDSLEWRPKKSVGKIIEESPYLWLYKNFLAYNQEHGLADPYQLADCFDPAWGMLPREKLFLHYKDHLLNFLVPSQDEILTGRLMTANNHGIVLEQLAIATLEVCGQKKLSWTEIEAVELVSVKNRLLEKMLANV